MSNAGGGRPSAVDRPQVQSMASTEPKCAVPVVAQFIVSIGMYERAERDETHEQIAHLHLRAHRICLAHFSLLWRLRLWCLQALVGPVRPLQLHRVLAVLLCLPRTDVADLAIHIVVPAAPGDRIGDRLAQLMRAGRCQRVERR
jgi:hypothetical protein